MSHLMDYRGRLALACLFGISLLAGCHSLRVPAIDPSGNRVFLPCNQSTTLLGPKSSRAGATPSPFGPAPFSSAASACPPGPDVPVQPAFQHPSKPDPCLSSDQKGCGGCLDGFLCRNKSHVIPKPCGPKTAASKGQIIMTPHRIIAPVGSEVVVLSGICGEQGRYLMNQPLEWMLSNDSVGQFIEVGGNHHPTFNRLVPPTAQKIDGSYAEGRTGLKKITLSRGTPTPVDDIELLQGQTYVSVSSESAGTSYITGVARKAEAWDKRRSATIIHWVDGVWSIPVPTTATAGTQHPLTTVVSKSTTGGGLQGWRVKYTIVGGAPAGFEPTGAQTAEATTDANGQATVQIKQPAGQFDPGTTQVRVDVIRPQMYGEPELQVESGITSVSWSAPALTIRAIGPKAAGVGEAYNYRIEITNPGDQVARDVRVRSKSFDDNLEYISATPKPTQFGREFEWNLGDIAPGVTPRVIDVQVKSGSRGNVNACFEVRSESDGLQTEACAQTEISVPCIGLEVEGPDEAQTGDRVTFKFKVVNQCQETLKNIRLRLQYDTGISIPGLGNPIEMQPFELPFGETKVVQLEMVVNQPGTRCFDLSVTSDGGHTARARECLQATTGSRPNVTMTVDGNRLAQVGGRPLVDVIIRNNSDQQLNELTLNNRFSASLRPDQVTEGIPVSELAPDEIAFSLGSLAPGQERRISVEYTALQADGNAKAIFSLTNRVGSVSETRELGIRIEAGQNNPAANNGPIRIPGDGAGLDPQGRLDVQIEALQAVVRVGDNVEFRFTVKNDRRTADQNIDISILVPNTLTVIDIRALDNDLRLDPNSSLPEYRLNRRREMIPGETITFQAVCRTTQAGQASLEVSARSANSTGPISDAATITVQ